MLMIGHRKHSAFIVASDRCCQWLLLPVVKRYFGVYILLLTLRAILADIEVYIPGQLRSSDRLVAVGD